MKDDDRFGAVPPQLPELPQWLKAVDEKSDDPKVIESLASDLFEALMLLCKAREECSESAFQLALLIEDGRTPVGPRLHESMAWYEYAAECGSFKAAFRLALLQDSQKPEAGKRMIVRALEILKNDCPGVNSRAAEWWNTAAKIVLYALEHGHASGENEAIALLLEKQGFQAHPDFELIAERARLKRGNCRLTLVVSRNKISEDSDFKVGVYRRLESPLALVSVPADMDAVNRQLDQEFPWFSNINVLVCRQLKVAQMSIKPAFRIRPLLLAGAPGVGKTTWARRFAEICGVPFRTVMAAGGNDAIYLRGTARGWSSARPGGVIQAMATEEVANPLFMIDELEKASSSNRNGRIWDVLLQMLEPASSKNYLDECLQVPCDLSWVSWIASVNELGQLPRPLIERFTVAKVESPGPGHFFTLVQGSIARFAEEMGLDPRMLPALGGEDLEVLQMCKSPREINRTVTVMLEKRLASASNLMH